MHDHDLIERSNTHRRNAITEITNACTVFEKYKIKRFNSMHKPTGFPIIYSIENNPDLKFDEVSELCRHLTPDTLPRIKELQDLIVNSHKELTKLIGE